MEVLIYLHMHHRIEIKVYKSWNIIFQWIIITVSAEHVLVINIDAEIIVDKAILNLFFSYHLLLTTWSTQKPSLCCYWMEFLLHNHSNFEYLRDEDWKSNPHHGSLHFQQAIPQFEFLHYNLRWYRRTNVRSETSPNEILYPSNLNDVFKNVNCK